MPIRFLRRHAPTRGAHQKALLDQVGLDHVFQRAALFGQRRRQRFHADRAAVEILDDEVEQTTVEVVEAFRIDLQHQHRGAGDVMVDVPRSPDLREVADPAQQAVGDARGAARASGDFIGALGGAVDAEDLRRAAHDPGQLFGTVELEPLDDAETVAERRGQQPGAGGRADQRERRQIELDRTRCGAFADHDVELEILHRRIQHFLDHRREAVDLVDEQHVVRLQIGEQRGEVAGLLDHRPRGDAQIDAEFVGDDMAERGLAQARRPEDQHMVQRFAATLGRFDVDRHLLAHRLLAEILVQPLRTDGGVEDVLFATGAAGDDAVCGHPDIMPTQAEPGATTIIGPCPRLEEAKPRRFRIPDEPKADRTQLRCGPPAAARIRTAIRTRRRRPRHPSICLGTPPPRARTNASAPRGRRC